MSAAGPIERVQTQAEALGASLPALLAQADQLAAHVMMGEHGRRRAGQGDEFWQYRPALVGDEARQIDWRQSAKSDAQFIREREWQAAQSVTLWVDRGQSMTYRGQADRPSKAERAQLLALALAGLLLRGGERVGLAGDAHPPRSGRGQLVTLAATLCAPSEAQEYSAPQGGGMQPHGRAVFFSDFFGDLEALEAVVVQAADRGVRGILLQVLDPDEEDFPFSGRTIFQSMTGAMRFETQQAGDLRRRYLERLAQRKDRLTSLARMSGWQMSSHHSGQPALSGLQWLYHGLQGGR